MWWVMRSGANETSALRGLHSEQRSLAHKYMRATCMTRSPRPPTVRRTQQVCQACAFDKTPHPRCSMQRPVARCSIQRPATRRCGPEHFCRARSALARGRRQGDVDRNLFLSSKIDIGPRPVTKRCGPEPMCCQCHREPKASRELASLSWRAP